MFHRHISENFDVLLATSRASIINAIEYNKYYFDNDFKKKNTK